MTKKTKKSLNSIMKSRTHSIKDKSKMLVQCILNKDPLSANKIFPALVSEAEDLRQLEVKKLLLEDDEDDDWGDDDSADDSEDDSDEEDDSEDDDSEQGDDEEDGQQQQDDQADTDTDKVIDDAIEIKCQINAKVIENLFDVISDLKNTLNSKDLDETSKEFITLDTTISYYSDKLQELQAQTNPGTDQTKLEEKLDAITKALDELKEKAGSSDGSDSDEVQTPQDVEDSEQDQSEEGQNDEEESEDQSDEQEDEQSEEDQEDQEQQQSDEDEDLE